MKPITPTTEEPMSRMIYVNLPVKDLNKSVDFFTQLGFKFDPNFTDESATCMIISDDAFIMLLVEDRFRDFTKKDISDATTQTEAILALSADSREEVDELVNKALAAGGQPSNDRMDEGFMYGWSFQDIDGHLWEVIYMDPSAVGQ
jgi:predicted lactoylglutathione lyase